LLFLNFFEVTHILFCAVSGAAGKCELTLHHFVVFFDLLQRAVELVELVLGFKNTFELFIGFFFLRFVLALEDFVLAFGFDAVALNDVVVVVGALECGLHFGELVLDSVELYTGVFTRLADFTHFFFLLSKLEIDTFMLIRQLFR